MKIKKLWGSRFHQEPPQRIIEFLSGRDVEGVFPSDQNLIEYDTWGSKAHAIMLQRQGIISEDDLRVILSGLREIEGLFIRGEFVLDESREDVHSNVEGFLIERYGIESAGKLHTARSRNDQITVDMRLYMRGQVFDFTRELDELIGALLGKAQENLDTVMPGFTHHQHAMVTTFAHVLLSFAEPLERDIWRFIHWYRLFNKNPLGGVAGYGSTFPLDRELTSKLLAFDTCHGNSLDPITNRWEPELELAYAIATTMNHLSTIAQSFIMMSTPEFDMVKLDDTHCSGSSIMPQKRNPGALEVIKGKASVAQGILSGLLSLGKSSFIGYNRDSQWAKYLIMDMVRECKPALWVMKEVIELLQVNRETMLGQCRKGFIGATALLEELVQRFQIPFRQAKILMEKAVKYSEDKGAEMVIPEGFRRALKKMNLGFEMSDAELLEGQDPLRVVSRKTSKGGPSTEAVKTQIDGIRERLKGNRRWNREGSSRIEDAKKEIQRIEESLGITAKT
ncbi:MAG: argininosuccinate lyase [Syntrophobacterales bacterium]|nr:MAG: argininosuccinate lyase [Syntrophobacterales bacterium]